MVLVVSSGGLARADGAFPDSFALFAPADKPFTLRLATNFGLVLSDDAGEHWYFVCERAAIAFATLYSEGPDDALYAVSTLGLVSSRDNACVWSTAQGSLMLSAVDDVFPDPSDAQHVLAIARVVGDAGTAGDTMLYESHDGGLTFGAPIYTPTPGRVITGVEIAASDPKTIYMTMYDNGPHPWFARSVDGGANFTLFDLGGTAAPRLIKVDPQNPQRVFLRMQPTDGEALSVTTDGGNTFTTPLTVTGKMTAFLLRSDGTLLVGSVLRDMAQSWRSTDNGATFADWPIGLHLRGLAERGTRLFAVGDDVLDKGALWQSDDGDHFTNILRFRDIVGPADCVKTVCTTPWMQLQPLINPNGPDVDAGADTAGGGGGSDNRGISCDFADGTLGLLPFVCILLAVALRRAMRYAK
jgi:hypothetical protein